MVEPVPLDGVPAALHSAVVQMQNGRLSEARALLDRVLTSWPDQPDALHLLGICVYQQGDDEAAIVWLARAVAAAPEVPEFLFNFGNALRRSGRRLEAINAYGKALHLRPGLAPALSALAELLREERRFADAAILFQQMGERDPSAFDAWSGAGEMWLAVGKLEAAMAAMQRAVALRPESCKAWNNLGVARSQLGFLQPGLDAFKRAIELDPSHVRALGNYANALRDAGRLDEARSCFESALRLAPDDPMIRSNALFSALYSDRLAAPEVLVEHRQFDAAVARLSERSNVQPQPSGVEKTSPIRVAYLSPDFCDHPVAYFMDGLLLHHRRENVDVHLYYCGLRADDWTRRLQSRPVRWRDVSALGDEALQVLAQQDGIDILVDLAGHTAYNRMVAVSRRLAPVQVHYLGYPFSTGVAAIDYRLTDGIVDPPGAEHLASETLLRLSRSYYAYSPPDQVPDISPLPLEQNGVPTFGVASNLAKVSPLAISRWAELLLAIPGARLKWRAKAFADPGTVARMSEALTARGVSEGRFDLSPWVSSTERWAFFQQVDLALDTFPYNQATNTCEALWMGVPTLTVLGESHQARMGASIMNAAGLPEFVAPDAQAWVSNGLKMLESPAKLAAIRSNLRHALKQSPLLDSAGLAAEMEAIYRRIC